MDPAGRDLGLRRLSRLTRWTVGAAVALTGVFSALVAHARPGHAKAVSATTTTTVPAPGDSFLQPPSQPPTQSGGGGLVTSGAS
jgi:hypothetical protein